MSYVDGIFAVFGGAREVARAGGWALSTVKSWQYRGSIPDAHKPGVLAAARDRNLPLRPEHFFPGSVPVLATFAAAPDPEAEDAA